MTIETKFYRFVVKRALAAEFAAANTLLLEGEYALELDTGLMKMGDGVTTWATLSYIISGPMDFTGLADGMVMVWDATAETWKAATPSGGSGSSTTAIAASENIPDSSLVNIWDDSGTPKVRLADATAYGKEAHGFVIAGVSSGAMAQVGFSGPLTGLTGLPPGATIYLSTTAGQVSASWVTTTGNVHQVVGEAYSATAINFNKQPPITLTGP